MMRKAYAYCGLCYCKMSVRLSVTRRYCVQMAKHIFKLVYRQVATLFHFFHANSMAIFRQGQFNVGVECR